MEVWQFQFIILIEIVMKAGVVGLGKMGFNMALHLLECGHELVAFDLAEDAVFALAEKGAVAAHSIEELADMLESPRLIWLMVPAGAPVDSTIDQLAPMLDRGDIIVDGGNSHYIDSERRAAHLKEQGISFLDAGTSGGLEGARHGIRRWKQICGFCKSERQGRKSIPINAVCDGSPQRSGRRDIPVAMATFRAPTRCS